ncbi:hypothetical protein MKEN_01165300 [Mycena kentingensis (nom. inval.)]|nr:hypothetical protein MKEN_01165300 [Mycena kentingensis (nom. inval.)]
MAALFLHNSIWVPDPDADDDNDHGRSSHVRTTSSSTLQFSEQSHPTQPLLHSATSESVAYMDLLSRQPTHPSLPRSQGAPSGLSFDGDPTTMRERKDMQERVVRRRLRRLRRMTAVLEVIVAAWAAYTTVRYFLAYTQINSSPAGQIASIVLGAVSLASFAALGVSVLVPYLQTYILGNHSVSKSSLNVARLVLRYATALLLLSPSFANLILAIVWRKTSSAALSSGVRCQLDIDVVWSIKTPQSCNPPSWTSWLVLAVVRLLVTVVVLVVYLVALAYYDATRRPSRHGRQSSASSHSTYVGSPPNSALALPSQSSSSTLTRSNSRLTPAPERRALRSSRSRGGSGSPPSGAQRLSQGSSSSGRSHDPLLHYDSSDGEYDPYAEAGGTSSSPPPMSEADRELFSFVERFRSLVSQVSRETSSGIDTSNPSSSQAAFLAANSNGRDEFGRPISMQMRDDRVLILNSYIRRMPTIESIGSREVGSSVVGTAPSVAGSSIIGPGDQAISHRASIAASIAASLSGGAGPGSVSSHATSTATTPALSRAPTLSTLAAAEAAAARASLTSAVDGLPDNGSPTVPAPTMDRAEWARILRRGSASSSASSGAGSSSYFSGIVASPLATPIAEEPPQHVAGEDIMGGLPPIPLVPVRPSPAAVRPLPSPSPVASVATLTPTTTSPATSTSTLRSSALRPLPRPPSFPPAESSSSTTKRPKGPTRTDSI